LRDCSLKVLRRNWRMGAGAAPQANMVRNSRERGLLYPSSVWCNKTTNQNYVLDVIERQFCCERTYLRTFLSTFAVSSSIL
jgi:hypothetical protein